SCITTADIILAAIAASHLYSPILLPAISAALAFGAGLLMQYLARKFSWGRRSGTVGALAATLGYGLAAYGGEDLTVPIFIISALLLSSAYGLFLRVGLLGIDT